MALGTLEHPSAQFEAMETSSTSPSSIKAPPPPSPSSSHTPSPTLLPLLPPFSSSPPPCPSAPLRPLPLRFSPVVLPPLCSSPLSCPLPPISSLFSLTFPPPSSCFSPAHEGLQASTSMAFSPQSLASIEALSDDEGEEEEEITEAEHSPSPSPSANGSRKSLHSQKIERILHKVWKLLREFELPKDLDMKSLECEILSTLNTLPALKVRKKTVNQTTAVVAFYILKKRVFPEISVGEVIVALKKIERTHSLSRSGKPNYSRNHSEVLGITKLATSLESSMESKASPSCRSPEEGHARSSQEATRALCRSLQLGTDVEELAAKLAALSDDSSLASRHLASVSASLVLVAAKRLKKKVTLTKVADTANVSSCTIRKAVKALEELIAQKGEPNSM